MPVTAPLPARTTIAQAAPTAAPVQAVATLPAPLSTPAPIDFAARAHELMASDLPRAAQRAERRVLQAMSIAAQPDSARQEDEIRRAANAIRDMPDLPLPAAPGAADEARVLHEAARVAFWRRGNAREAFDLQSRAFGANPLDADIVGSLAFLSLKQGAPQAELARQLALYAIGLQDGRQPGWSIEDWTTLAIASALVGRDRDARNAWFVSLALAPQPERQCRAAVNAYALHGERLRAPVEAMLYRAHLSGRAQVSALCEWPPHWMASDRSR